MVSAGAFYRGNSANSIGHPARVMIAPFSYPMPTKIDDIVDITGPTPSYDPVATYGFRDIGITRNELSMGHQAETVNWDNQQFGRFLIMPTNYFATITTEALEPTADNKVELLQASQVTDSATNEARFNYAARTSFPLYRIAVLGEDRHRLLHASVFPRCQWDGSQLVQQLARATQQVVPFNFMGWVDETVIDTDTGQGCYRVDFDQYLP